MQLGGHEAGRQAAKLRARVAQGDGFTALRLEGIIDEHNGLAQIGDAMPSGGDTLLVDLGGIKRLNSVGVRDWVNWLREMHRKYGTVVLFDCPAPVMNEVNFVKNFAEGAYISSFAAPLFCALCNKEESRLLATHEIHDGANLTLPAYNCERTDCQNALDDDEESYFSFVRTLPVDVDVRRLARLSGAARALLAASGTALVDASKSSAGGPDGVPGRSPPLEQLGLQGTVRRPAVPARDDPMGASVQAAGVPAQVQGDWLFIAAMVAMLAVLGVLIYLILTLE